jgi:type I restriction enzyme, S subunit
VRTPRPAPHTTAPAAGDPIPREHAPDSGIGHSKSRPDTRRDELPERWQMAHLGDVARVRYGLGEPPEEDPTGLPIIRATNVKRGRISSEGLLRIKASSLALARRNPFLRAGDIIVVRSGAYTGDVAMVTAEWEGAVTGYDLILSPNEQIDSSFCALQLLTKRVQGYFRGQRDRAAQPHLNRQQLEATEICVPPILEQRAIATVLRTVERAKEACEQVIAATRQLKQSLLHHLFTYGPVPFDQADKVTLKETEIGPMPLGWVVQSLDQVWDSQLGKMLSPKARIGGSPRPYLRNANVQWGRVDLRDLSEMSFQDGDYERYGLRPGDILICEGGEVGRTAIWKGELPQCYYQKALHRLRQRGQPMNPEFFSYHMMHAFLIRNSYGEVDTVTTIAHLPGVKLKTLPLPFRPLRSSTKSPANSPPSMPSSRPRRSVAPRWTPCSNRSSTSS